MLNHVNRTESGEVHLDDITVSFEAGSFNVLLGRTLSGKTSLLRLLAGLDKADSGQVLLEGKDVSRLPVQQRNVSMVYQQFINYPHLTVYDNIASPLRVAGEPSSDIKSKVAKIAALLHIEEFLDRYPLELSGGQQQRAAMARALVKDASLVLFDEPLVNLDYKLREELRIELRQLFEKSNAIVVYATTEPSEALALGGVTHLLHEGRLIQSGAAIEVYSRPNNVVAAELFSEPSLNMLSVTKDENQLNQLMGIRPEHVCLSKSDDSDVAMELIVDVAEISGSETFLHMHMNTRDDIGQPREIIARLRGVHRFESGDTVTVYLPQAKLFHFDTQGDTLVDTVNEKTSNHSRTAKNG